eukprot:3206676-Rhodomonas_salina.2
MEGESEVEALRRRCTELEVHFTMSGTSYATSSTELEVPLTTSRTSYPVLNSRYPILRPVPPMPYPVLNSRYPRPRPVLSMRHPVLMSAMLLQALLARQLQSVGSDGGDEVGGGVDIGLFTPGNLPRSSYVPGMRCPALTCAMLLPGALGLDSTGSRGSRVCSAISLRACSSTDIAHAPLSSYAPAMPCPVLTRHESRY